MKLPFLTVFQANTLCPLLAGFLLPVLLTQCKTAGGSYKDVEYDPAALKTPSGHGMEKKDYPFDDNGNYRKDWVKNKASGKVRSASKLPEETGLASTESSTDSSSGYYGPADAGGVASSDAMEVVSAAPAVVATAPSSASYHKVVSGDTLYSLSQRYGTSVDQLKSVNGLSSNNIRTGQSLRIP